MIELSKIPARRIALAVLLLSCAAIWMARDRELRVRQRASPVRFALDFSTSLPLGPPHSPFISLSPGGGLLAYVLGGAEIDLRPLDDLASRRFATGVAISNPFFAPDGTWLAYVADGWLQRASLREDRREAICEAPTMRGACWVPGDRIVFTPSYGSGLWIVDAGGGPARMLTQLDSTRGEMTHRWPEALPGGSGVLFTVRTAGVASFDEADIAIVDLEGGPHRILMSGGSCPRYSPTGHLLYVRDGGLFAVPFDLVRGRITGQERRLLDGVAVNPSTGAAQYSLSPDGTLVYAPSDGDSATGPLLQVDRKGVSATLVRSRWVFENPRLSPDGTRVAVTLMGASNEIGVVDLKSGHVRVLTGHGGEDMTPVWSPDGRWVTFSSSRHGPLALLRISADGAREEALVARPNDLFACSWSPNGRVLAYMQDEPASKADLWLLDLDDPTSPHPWLCTPYSERAARFSPDGRWIAYDSDATGQFEVYVRPVRGGPARRISTTGGYAPVWSTSGRELFYRQGDQMMLVQVESGAVRFTPPRALFEGAFQGEFDVMHDGLAFIMTSGSSEQWPTRLHVLVGFLQQLERLAGGGAAIAEDRPSN